MDFKYTFYVLYFQTSVFLSMSVLCIFTACKLTNDVCKGTVASSHLVLTLVSFPVCFLYAEIPLFLGGIFTQDFFFASVYCTYITNPSHRMNISSSDLIGFGNGMRGKKAISCR